MFLWDQCIYSDEENIEEVYVGDTQVIKSSPGDYNLDNNRFVPNTPLPSKIVTSIKNHTFISYYETKHFDPRKTQK